MLAARIESYQRNRQKSRADCFIVASKNRVGDALEARAISKEQCNGAGERSSASPLVCIFLDKLEQHDPSVQ